MAEKMDKSLEDIIAEQRTKSKPRSKAGDQRKAETKPRASGGNARRQQPKPDSRRDGRQQVAAGPPPRDPAYYMHDDRAGQSGRQEGGAPRGSWKQQQRQQWDRQEQWERPRGRGAAQHTDPIITTADGWEEVAQEEPYRADRRGGGVQRRGGVFDRVSSDRRNGQQQFGGRFGRGRGRGGRGRGGFDEEEPRRRYVDEHDHREDASVGPAGRPGRFQPYRVAGGVSKRTARGPAPSGRKWGHDLFDPNQPQGPVGEEGYANEEGMME